MTTVKQLRLKADTWSPDSPHVKHAAGRFSIGPRQVRHHSSVSCSFIPLCAIAGLQMDIGYKVNIWNIQTYRTIHLEPKEWFFPKLLMYIIWWLCATNFFFFLIRVTHCEYIILGWIWYDILHLLNIDKQDSHYALIALINVSANRREVLMRAAANSSLR